MKLSYETDYPTLLAGDPGAEGWNYPEIEGWMPIIRTRSCLAIGIKHYVDGETEVLVSSGTIDCSGLTAIFNDVLETPTKTFAISTMENGTVYSAPVKSEVSRVQVFASSEQHPDKIVILHK